MKHLCELAIIVLLSAALAASGAASQVRELSWEDLAGTLVFEDPFEQLTPEQMYNLVTYARVEELKKIEGGKIPESMEEEARIAELTLRAEGVDIEYLVSVSPEIKKKRMQRAAAVVPELDGESVALPGYLLPLAFDSKKVTEFLLVPWFGACIHTPPPPPNQIVYVVVDSGYDALSQFAPVLVSGEMQVKSARKDLFLVDGEAGIDVGYTLIAEKVAPYTKKEQQ